MRLSGMRGLHSRYGKWAGLISDFHCLGGLASLFRVMKSDRDKYFFHSSYRFLFRDTVWWNNVDDTEFCFFYRSIRVDGFTTGGLTFDATFGSTP
jgi:hypothetical protein